MMGWEDYLSSRALAFLLPSSEVMRVSLDEASRLLANLTRNERGFRLLRLASTFAAPGETLLSFGSAVEALVRVLPSRSVIETKRWEGGFHGRLDVRATQLLHAQGARTSFVTRQPYRDFAFPETVFLRAVIQRIITCIHELREHEAVHEKHSWGQRILALGNQLEHLVQSSRLREVPLRSLDELSFEEGAARIARHRAYTLAVEWKRHLQEGIDSDDPIKIARVLSEGALWPVSPDTRFELAVTTRLVEAIHSRLVLIKPQGGFVFERAILRSDRRDLASFRVGQRSLEVFYNQAVLPSGAYERGVSHYLDYGGRMRPDVTIVVKDGAQHRTAIVIEVKNTPNLNYVAQGFAEAVLYRWEYAEHLRSWPHAIVISSCDLPEAKFKREDDVVATDWRRWVPPTLLDAIVDELVK